VTTPASDSDTPTPRPVNLAVLTVSDTRTRETDTSGDLLVERLTAAGHVLAERALIKDDRATLRALILSWCDRGETARADIEAIVITGGTGITGRDVTVDVLETLYDKPIPGFGELFRMLSYAEIGASTIQSRASAGTIGERVVFALPGSPGACRLAWDGILRHQLDVRSKPCNLVKLLPRLGEV
jgi:molybdopterin adenylyltransferase